ncbi:hypothetical protein LOZ53_001219 [Ophidiomyces ophidiicola]|nr:hypothetical protein LOZ55_000078 [Ophidiomyces ophidiicola]KAI1994678.1 hypothetical protein LOZ54_000912 [Ophidiomyces ophidiicola]KAI1996190.1 hypothetical protein LOZ53_001219 [Ophidiomyces ophidiicola]KAI2000791.1 hypothetical protein LOZ51_001077 [Ophidiomyces ophidiicola]
MLPARPVRSDAAPEGCGDGDVDGRGGAVAASRRTTYNSPRVRHEEQPPLTVQRHAHWSEARARTAPQVRVAHHADGCLGVRARRLGLAVAEWDARDTVADGHVAVPSRPVSMKIRLIRLVNYPPAAVERHKRLVRAVELDVQWRCVRPKRQPRRLCPHAELVRLAVSPNIVRKLAAHPQAVVVGDITHLPRRAAERIPVIEPARIVDAPVEVQLLARVVCVDVAPVAPDIVDRVFHRPDAMRAWMLCDTHRVAQAPAQPDAIARELVAAHRHVLHAESLHLAVSRRLVAALQVHVARAAAHHHQISASIRRVVQRPRRVARVAQPTHHNLRFVGPHTSSGGIVVPGVDAAAIRRVQSPSIRRQRDAVIQSRRDRVVDHADTVADLQARAAVVVETEVGYLRR